MNAKQNKNARILSLYTRLCDGKLINKSEEAKRFGVDERSIQRDIDDIRAFIKNSTAEHSGTYLKMGDRWGGLQNLKGVCLILTKGKLLDISEL